jgi:hypothetical protein
MKKRRVNHRKAAAPAKDAWAAAAAYGVDMNLLEINLRRTPTERIDAHQAALDLMRALQAAGKRRDGKP